MNLRRIILYLLLGTTNLLIAQSNEEDKAPLSWKEISASESIENFKKFDKHFTGSFSWAKTEERLAYYEKGYAATLELGLDTFVFDYSRELGYLYTKVDSMEDALKYMNANLEHAFDYESKSISYNMFAFLHINMGDYSSALDYLFKSVEESKLGEQGSEVYALGNISDVYVALDDYDNALKYTQIAIPLSKSFSFPEKEYNLSYDYSHLIEFYNEKNQKDSAEYYIEMTREILSKIDTFKEDRFQDAIISSYMYIVDYYLDNGMFEIAKIGLDEIKKRKRPLDKVAFDLLKVKYKLAKKDYRDVLYILDGINLSNEEFTVIEEVYELKIDYFKGIGNSIKALEVQDALIKLKEEKYGKDRLRFSAFANAKFEALQKQEEIEALKQGQKLDKLTIDNQKYLVVIFIILALLLSLGAFYLWQQNKQRNKFSSYLQEKIKLKTKDLEQANEELRAFNYIASHNIKEPIRSIGNFVGLIKHKLPPHFQEELSEYFLTVKSSTTQLYTLIEDFARYTAMSKNEAIDIEEINLNILLNNVKDSLYDFTKKVNGRIVYSELPIIISNNSLLHAALKNLIGNGLKYNNSEIPIVEVRYASKEFYHEIIISDNGIGIEEAYQEKIFEMLQKLHHRGIYEGVGIGLSIVKLVCKKLDGKIELNSEVGKGSIFVLKLPKQGEEKN